MRLSNALLAMFLLAVAPVGAVVAADADDTPLIRAAIDAGRLHQARTMLGKPDTATSTETEALWARLYLAEGRNEDALRAFDSLATRVPDSCTFLIGSGIAASRSGKPDRAIAAIEQAAGKCLLGWEAWRALGKALDATRRWEDSASAYTHALALRPSNPALLHDIGISMLLQRRFAPAAAYLRAALRLAPGDVTIIDDLDAALASIGEPPVRNMATEDAARWAERLDNAGRAAMRAGLTSEARALLTAAVTTSPTYRPEALLSLAELQSRR